MKLLKKTAKIFLLIFVFLQFFNPDKNIEPGEHLVSFKNETNPSDSTVEVLKSSCYNCHSNHTNYPWYNNIAPLSFWMANDIRSGKEALNFSNWEAYTKEEKADLMEEISEAVYQGTMPKRSYLWFRPEAKISESQKEDITNWAKRTKVLFELGPLPK